MSFFSPPHVSKIPRRLRTAAIQKPHLMVNYVAAGQFSGGIMDKRELSSEKFSRRSFLSRSLAAENFASLTAWLRKNP